MALDDVVKLVNSKDEQKRVQATLHEMYLKESAEKPSYDDFDEKFQFQLHELGLDNSTIEEFAEAVGDLMLVDAEFEGNPEELAKEFIKKDAWTPPVATQTVTTEELSSVDGFLKDKAGQFFLPDRVTKVFAHTGYPGQGVYYDVQNKLYQKGQLFTPWVDVDGFVRNPAGQMFLTDRTTEVFAHTGYPDQAVYYDRQNQLYQHGQPYEAATKAPAAVDLSSVEEIKELFNSDSNYEELQEAVAAKELTIEYDDEDISSFDEFVNA